MTLTRHFRHLMPSGRHILTDLTKSVAGCGWGRKVSDGFRVNGFLSRFPFPSNIAFRSRSYFFSPPLFSHLAPPPRLRALPVSADEDGHIDAPAPSVIRPRREAPLLPVLPFLLNLSLCASSQPSSIPHLSHHGRGGHG